MPFDPGGAYRLHPQVALRPEEFGALAYHYGSRRLLFLKSRELVEVVEQLPQHESATSAVAAVTASEKKAAMLLGALANLEASGVIDAC